MEKRCVIEGCRNWGNPSDGQNYFACEDCRDELEDAVGEHRLEDIIRHLAEKREARTLQRA